MTVALLTLELEIPGAASLKDRRNVVNSLLGRVQARFNVSAAQLDRHGGWHSATLAFVALCNAEQPAVAMLNKVRDLVEGDARCDVVSCALEILA